MAVAKADWDQMKQVADFFEKTRLTEEELAQQRQRQKKRGYRARTGNNGSISETAAHFHLTRTKVTKMLVTMGLYTSPLARRVQALRDEGMSIQAIAERLEISTGTVSSYIPYTDEFHASAEPSEHARAVREYRAYEKARAERQIQNQDGETKREERKGQEMSGEGRNGEKRTNEISGDDWKKELDSRLSFTETESRRQRLTYELIRQSGLPEQSRSMLEAAGIPLPVFDREKERRELRAKASLTPEEVLDLGEFPGALNDRNTLDLEEIYGERLPYEPREMIRLHLELVAGFSEEDREIMHQYGGMTGETVSRDILVSGDLPLYALHYVIQRVFGWQNSHLHRFFISDDRMEKLTESMEQWMHQVGVIYRSPLMGQYEEFWADDYRGGSFKNWLRKKYTGPCVSQCRGEGLIACREDMKRLNPDEEYYVEFGYYRLFAEDAVGEHDEGRNATEEGRGCGKAVPLRCRPVYDRDGKKTGLPEADRHVQDFRVEVMKLRDLPVRLLDRLFDRGAFDLLERLSIGQVLVPRNMHITDDFLEGYGVSSYQEMVDDGLEDEVDEILGSRLDSPMEQPYVYSFTDELLYQYDFGDDWQIRITGSRNCTDLVESGKITQDMLDRSNIKARVTYRPVLLARDGEMLIDDVGGPDGMAEFIRSIHTMKRGEKDVHGLTAGELRNWAKCQGWHKDDSTDFNLI